MKKSIKMLWNFYYCDWKKRKLWHKIRTPIATFLLILFLFAFLSYHVVRTYHATAAFQYAKYDVELLNASPQQMEEIKEYDYVEKRVAYTLVSGVSLEHQGNQVIVDFISLKSDTLSDLDYTPWHEQLAIERNLSIMGDVTQNPIALSENEAVQLGVDVGDVVEATIGQSKIKYTVAGIYEDAVFSANFHVSYVLIQGDLLDWLVQVSHNSGEENITRETFGCSHAYVTFNDVEKGKEFVQNYIADIDLYPQYGEDWREEASEEELLYYRGSYNTREEMLQNRRDNSIDQFSNVVWIVLLGSLALVLFIFWERNRTVTLTMRSLTVLVAEGCSKAGIFTYFLISTFLKQLGYFLLAIPIIQYPFMSLISSESHIYRFSGFLLLQCLPFVIGLLLMVSLVTGVFLYVKFTKKIVLFTGEE